MEDYLHSSLDLETLKPLAASHAYQIAITQNLLEVFFDDINLPDSTTNLVASQGFFTFEIYLRFNPSLTNVDGLAKLTALTNLDLSDNPSLTNVDGLVNLTALTNLDLSDNPSLTNVDGLAKLLNLRSLYLRNTAIPKDKKAELQRALPNCRILF